MSIQKVYQGTAYVFDGTRWYDANTYVVPPTSIVTQLNLLIESDLAEIDKQVTDFDELLAHAKQAEAASQFDRALNLAKRACAMKPSHAGGAAVLCSLLRQLHKSEEALAIAERFRASNYAPVLTSRAAALCDLQRWEEALKQIRQVLAILKDAKNKSEAFGVHQRIKANAPHLFLNDSREVHDRIPSRPMNTIKAMSKVEQVENAVRGLSRDELSAFRDWFAEFEAEAWDREFEEDVTAGKLDQLAEKAIRDLKEGRCTKL